MHEPAVGPGAKLDFALFRAGVPAMRCIFGQNAAQCQIVGLVMIAAAVVALACVSAPVVRVFSWLAIPVGLFTYVILGHAPIYGWLLWWHALRDSDREGGSEK
jgi:hypothetical protein